MAREEDIQLEKLSRKKRLSMNGRRWLMFAVLFSASFGLWRWLRIPASIETRHAEPSCPGKEDSSALRAAAADFEAGEFEQALSALAPLVRAGCAPAQVMQAGLHWAGLGVPKDAAKATELYAKAAASGYAPALVALGDRYYSGDSVPRDLTAAYENYRRAAELDGGQGLWNAAALLERADFEPPSGRRKAQDSLLAAALKTAQEGRVPAQLFLGQVYENGRLGVKPDGVSAYKWYSIAGEAGNGYAQWRAALACHYGRGIRTDYAAAARWYALAAKNGYGQARWNLAFMLAHGGPGFKRSVPQALRWLFMGPPRGVKLRVNSGPLAGTDRYF